MDTAKSPVSHEIDSSSDTPLAGSSTAIPKPAQCKNPQFFRAFTHEPFFQKPTSAYSSQINADSEALTIFPPPDAAEDTPLIEKVPFLRQGETITNNGLFLIR